VNPFLSRDEIDSIIKHKKDIVASRDTSRSQKLFIFEKTNSLDRVVEIIKKSNENERVPLIVTSKALDLTKQQFYKALMEKQNKPLHEFDLRAAHELKKDASSFKQYMFQVKKNLAQTLVKGETFVVNIDDTTSAYDEIYDPDIREFYNADTLPSQLFKLSELNKAEVHERVLLETESRMLKLNKSYNLLIWSKFRIDSELEFKKLMEKFERRFSSILPMINLDMIIITT